VLDRAKECTAAHASVSLRTEHNAALKLLRPIMQCTLTKEAGQPSVGMLTARRNAPHPGITSMVEMTRS
jgi:hypothetical protein